MQRIFYGLSLVYHSDSCRRNNTIGLVPSFVRHDQPPLASQTGRCHISLLQNLVSFSRALPGPSHCHADGLLSLYPIKVRWNQ